MNAIRLLAGQLDLSAAAELLSASAAIRDRGCRERELVFLDSADRLLRGAGFDAVHQGHWLELRSRTDGTSRGRCRLEAVDGPLRLSSLQAPELGGRLRKLVGERALLAVIRVSLQAWSIDVLDELQKTVVRVELQGVKARTSPRGPSAELGTLIHLQGLRGYEPELFRLGERLLEVPGVVLAGEPLADQALRACGGNPEGLSSRVEVALSPDLRADAAAAAVSRRLLEVIEDNLPGAVEDLDPEFLHDLRVAVRRTRSVQRELKRVFPAVELARHRDAFRWLQRVTGEVRDLDVQLGEFDELLGLVPAAARPDLDPLREVLLRRRQRAQERLVVDLSGRRTRAMLRDWAALLEDLVELPREDRPDSATPIGRLVARRVAKVHHRMVKMGREIDETSPAGALHDLRKRGKELRYLLELFAVRLGPESVVTPMVKSLKGLQDVLGRHQDRQVQIELIRSLAEEVAERPGGPRALVAMGALLSALDQDEQAARCEFTDRFSGFAGRPQRKLVKETFR